MTDNDDARQHELQSQVEAALDTVKDPEIKRPITELGMVDYITIDEAGNVVVKVLLTIAGCPLHATIENDVRTALANVQGVNAIEVQLGVMTDEQRTALRQNLQGGRAKHEIPFAQPGNLTRVISIASGKGGVGKSSLTVNLAVALAQRGLQVGLLDADIYGHSIPDMLGIGDEHPTLVEGMIMPVPAYGIKVISMGMLKQSRDQVIAWRGPMLDRGLQQFLADVYWGDLDFLLVDLPPGTGDVALSIGQKLPGSEVLVITTPQVASAEVAERAGTMAGLMHQEVIGVVENMSWLETTCPHCHRPHRIELFGSGGGVDVARRLAARLGKDVPLLAQIPLDAQVRESGDTGLPVVHSQPDNVSAKAIIALAELLSVKPRGLAGEPLGVSVK